jgi:cytoskeleton protein RodZ
LDENPASFHELIMQFSADCWVEVKDANGERLAYGIIKANEVRTLNGEMPFSITLGNAAAAQIKLDGRSVDRSVYLDKSSGGVARFVLDPPAPG